MTHVPMVVGLLSSFIHIPILIFFMGYLEMDIIGLAIAADIKDALLLIAVTIYSCCSETIQKSMVPVDREAFRGWKEYLSISAPTTLMMCAEWWAFELVVLLAGIISVTALAAQTVCFTITSFLYMVPLAF